MSEQTGQSFGGVEIELEVMIRARYPLIFLESYEEERVVQCLAQIAKNRGKDLVTWSLTKGLVKYSEAAKAKSCLKQLEDKGADPVAALEEVVACKQPVLFLFKDFHPFLSDKKVIRKLKETASALQTSLKTLCLVSHQAVIPEELAKDMAVLPFPLPDNSEIGQLLDMAVRQASANNPRVKKQLEVGERQALISAARGLTLREAENAFARTLVSCGQLTYQEVSAVLEEKKRAIKKMGLLEYVDVADSIGQLGGLHSLKEWVRKRSVSFSAEARQFGLPAPKGLLLLGIQGCGKSLCARVISQVWHLPLLRLDAGKIFAGYIGSSEANVRRAIAAAESMAPAVLWIDEIEKAFAGMGGGAESDGGTSSRVFATLLTWLQEKQKPVFVAATANSIKLLPPELLRKGRFDEIFFVDLPRADERREILTVHLQRRHRSPENFNLESLSELSAGLSGSEIEQAIIAAMYEAFDLGRDLQASDIEKVLRQTVPLSETMKEEIEASRRWAATRARLAY